MLQLLKRIHFSLRMLHRYRHALAKIYHSSPRQLRLDQISISTLKLKGIAVLVLDFDGVLAAHGEPEPAEELEPWLQACIDSFGPKQVFVLSNKPLESRIAYFERHGVRCIVDVRKKPYPDGLQKIISLSGQAAEAVMLVDDRLLTGALAACIAQVSVTYITSPIVLLSKRPVSELFFMTLRFWERRIVSLYNRL